MKFPMILLWKVTVHPHQLLPFRKNRGSNAPALRRPRKLLRSIGGQGCGVTASTPAGFYGVRDFSVWPIRSGPFQSKDMSVRL